MRWAQTLLLAELLVQAIRKAAPDDSATARERAPDRVADMAPTRSQPNPTQEGPVNDQPPNAQQPQPQPQPNDQANNAPGGNPPPPNGGGANNAGPNDVAQVAALVDYLPVLLALAAGFQRAVMSLQHQQETDGEVDLLTVDMILNYILMLSTLAEFVRRYMRRDGEQQNRPRIEPQNPGV